jgi:hypothetical protein
VLGSLFALVVCVMAESKETFIEVPWIDFTSRYCVIAPLCMPFVVLLDNFLSAAHLLDIEGYSLWGFDG